MIQVCNIYMDILIDIHTFPSIPLMVYLRIGERETERCMEVFMILSGVLTGEGRHMWQIMQIISLESLVEFVSSLLSIPR